mgnify:FL=1
MVYSSSMELIVLGLKDCLREVRQLLDLFMVGPISEYLDLRIRRTKYYNIDPKKLIIIMEKYKVEL